MMCSTDYTATVNVARMLKGNYCNDDKGVFQITRKSHRSDKKR